jgi:hypothetical protein
MKKKPVDIQLIENKVKVTLSWIGEGTDGDYDPDNMEDAPLLRFDVFAHKSLKNPYAEDVGRVWCYMLDSSYCTYLHAFNKKTAKKAIKIIMSEVKDEVLAGHSIKRLCEGLSWMGTDSFVDSRIDGTEDEWPEISRTEK